MENTLWFGNQNHEESYFWNIQKPRTHVHHYTERGNRQIKSQVYEINLNINTLFKIIIQIYYYKNTATVVLFFSNIQTVV